MSDPSLSHPASEPMASDTTAPQVETPPSEAAEPNGPKPSYVKLAMRNMVRKRTQSLTHFALTTIGLLAFFVGVSYLTR
jgi:uncharacterized membrane protein